MFRRRGLTEEEILKELSNISPTQSEAENDNEDGDCAENDNDSVDEDFHCSSDSADSSSDEGSSPDLLASKPTLSVCQSRSTNQGKRGRVSADKDKDVSSTSGPSSKRQKPIPAQSTIAPSTRTRSGKSSMLPKKQRHVGSGDGDVHEQEEDQANSPETSGTPETVEQPKQRGRKSTLQRKRSAGDVEQSPDKRSWTYVENGDSAGRRSQQNVLKETSGPTGYAKRNIEHDSPSSALRLFISKSMLNLIKTCTETQARLDLGVDDWSVSLEELEAFIAICYARGALGSRGHDKYDLQDQNWAPPFFAKTMSGNRFSEILRFLRFYIRSTRSQRKVADKFCLASDLWGKFVDACLACYKPTANMTVDEQLYPTSWRCPFIQYMPSKPDKYGIKYWLLCDADNRYVLNGSPYLGKDEERPANRPLGEHVVLKLAEPYLDKGCNITTDNFITSTNLGENLKKRNTSLVGTLRRTKREVPLSVRGNNALYSTELLKSGDNLLTVYQEKTAKNVLVLSTMHAGCNIEEGTEKKIPETVRYYYHTKGGVDVVDQMSRMYSVRAQTRRWPVHVFYNVLDLSMINAHTIFQLVTNQKIKRRQFILKICDELAAPYIAARKSLNMRAVGNIVAGGEKREKCQILVDCKGNKTKDVCNMCQKMVCGSCQTQNVAIQCANCDPVV